MRPWLLPLLAIVRSCIVLLTRGRDGTVVFVPPAPEFTTTFRMLVDAGMQRLD